MAQKYTEQLNHTANALPNQEEEEGANIGELIATILDGKFLIFIITLIFFALGVLKAEIDTPIYMADAMLQLEEKSKSLDALGPVSDVMENSKVSALTEIEIIKSRKILGTAVKSLNLDNFAKPLYYPYFGEAIARWFQRNHTGISEPLFKQVKYAWGGEVIRLETFQVPESWTGKQLTLLAGEKGRFTLRDNNQPILEGSVGKLISKKVGHDQEQLTLFVAELKARPGTQFILMKQPLSAAIAQLNGSLTVVEKRGTTILSFIMASPDPALAVKTVDEVANIYVRLNVEQKSKEAQKTLEFLDKQLPLLKEQLEESTTAMNEYRTQKGSLDLELENKNILETGVKLKTELTLLEQKSDEMREKFTESYPSISAVDKQIARLKEQVSANDKKIGSLPETQQAILRLARDVEVNTTLYTTLLNNAQSLKVAKAGTVGNVSIIDQAVLPGGPIKPKKGQIKIIAVFIGLLIGIGCVFILKAMQTGVEDPDQVERKLNIPVYATIPHSNLQVKLSEKIKKLGKRDSVIPSVLALENKDDIAVESLRSLRTSLHFALLEAHNNIIMITGPSPSVGKSFISTNLAIVLADTGKKVLLIDADLRKGLVNKVLGVNREDGLSDLISGRINQGQAIRHIEGAGIDFIATGGFPPNPSELLVNYRFGELLEKLSENYDYIIIDSAPVLAVTDACIIGRLVGATLMVIKAGQHPMRELEQTVKRLSQAGVGTKGIVFNDLKIVRSKYGYSGYGYGKYVYGYSYQK